MGQVTDLFRQGGIFMWPLLFFSLLALTVIIERFIVLTKARINVNEFLTKIRKALLVNRNVKEAIKVCEQQPRPRGVGDEGRPAALRSQPRRHRKDHRERRAL